MSPAARTVHLFGVYLSAVGVSLVVIPNILLGVFRIPPTNPGSESWV